MDQLAAHNDLVSIADVVGQVPGMRRPEILAAVEWLTFLGVIQPHVSSGLTTTPVGQCGPVEPSWLLSRDDRARLLQHLRSNVKDRKALAGERLGGNSERCALWRAAALVAVGGGAKDFQTILADYEAVLRLLDEEAGSGGLPIYAPGKDLPQTVVPTPKSVTWSAMRYCYHEAFWNDLNSSLDARHVRIPFRFPDPAPVAAAQRNAQPSLPVDQQHPQAVAAAVKADRSRRAADAANKRHSRPGGYREKAEQLRALWARGKHLTRNDCAEQECQRLGVSVHTARKYLRNTPEPTRA